MSRWAFLVLCAMICMYDHLWCVVFGGFFAVPPPAAGGVAVAVKKSAHKT